ncbi:MAG: hypothetical protein AAGI23_09565 [Bacteroidota bacterium]
MQKKLYESQKEIIHLFEGDYERILTLTDICKSLGGKYYTNAAKYISVRCSALVKAKFLERTKRGHFRLYQVRRQTIEETIDNNQLSLF